MENTAKEKLEKKIIELQNIRKRCAEQNYFSVGMLANFAMRDFLDWHIKDMIEILKKLN
jgi:hypothetical protein